MNITNFIVPGNGHFRILDVILEESELKTDAYHIVLYLESQEVSDDFEGQYIDSSRLQLGRYKGKVGKVYATDYPFADGITKSGEKVSRDEEILKWLSQFCQSIGCKQWLHKGDNRFMSIESLFSSFKHDKPFGNEYYRFCIAGKEFKDLENNTRLHLFLPKFSAEGVPVERLDVEETKILIYNLKEHYKKAK